MTFGFHLNFLGCAQFMHQRSELYTLYRPSFNFHLLTEPSNNPPHASPILSLNLVTASLGVVFLAERATVLGEHSGEDNGWYLKTCSQNRELYIWRPTPRQENTCSGYISITIAGLFEKISTQTQHIL